MNKYLKKCRIFYRNHLHYFSTHSLQNESMKSFLYRSLKFSHSMESFCLDLMFFFLSFLPEENKLNVCAMHIQMENYLMIFMKHKVIIDDDHNFSGFHMSWKVSFWFVGTFSVLTEHVWSFLVFFNEHDKMMNSCKKVNSNKYV